MKPAPKAAPARQGSAPPDWAVVFVRKSTGKGVDSLVVEALARRIASMVKDFEDVAEKLPKSSAAVLLWDVIERAKNL